MQVQPHKLSKYRLQPLKELQAQQQQQRQQHQWTQQQQLCQSGGVSTAPGKLLFPYHMRSMGLNEVLNLQQEHDKQREARKQALIEIQQKRHVEYMERVRARLPSSIPDWMLVNDNDDDLNDVDMMSMSYEQKKQVRALRKVRKMDREKVKRAKENDQFDFLLNMLNMGRSTRVEKQVLLTEAVQLINRLQHENETIRLQKGVMFVELLKRRGSGSVNQLQSSSPSVTEQIHRLYQKQLDAFAKFNENQLMQFNHCNQSVSTPTNFHQSCNTFSKNTKFPDPNDFEDPLNLRELPLPLPLFEPLPQDDSIDMFLEDGDTSGLLCL